MGVLDGQVLMLRKPMLKGNATGTNAAIRSDLITVQVFGHARRGTRLSRAKGRANAGTSI